LREYFLAAHQHNGYRVAIHVSRFLFWKMQDSIRTEGTEITQIKRNSEKSKQCKIQHIKITPDSVAFYDTPSGN